MSITEIEVQGHHQTTGPSVNFTFTTTLGTTTSIFLAFITAEFPVSAPTNWQLWGSIASSDGLETTYLFWLRPRTARIANSAHHPAVPSTFKSFTFTASTGLHPIAGEIVLYQASGIGIESANGASSLISPSLTAHQATDVLVTYFAIKETNAAVTLTTPSGITLLTRVASLATFPTHSIYLGHKALSATGATGTHTSTASAGAANKKMSFSVLLTHNRAPNAPTLTAPANTAHLDRAAPQTFAWTFSDPDVGDTQSAFTLRYRVAGTTTWTTISRTTTPTSNYTIAGGTFSANRFEWQVRTADRLGSVGSWSSSKFFVAATKPTAPTITAPTSGATLSAPAQTATWSASSQTAYQVRRVKDLTGAATTGTIYFDSGQVTSSTVRSLGLTFSVNSRFEHVQVRVKRSGIWSTYADVRVHVSYTAPAAPTLVTATPSAITGSILITHHNPTPTGTQPTVSFVNIYRSSATQPEIRLAINVTPNANFTDYLPASGVAYTYRVEAVGSNGATTSTSVT